MHKLPYLYNFYFNLEYSISNMRMRSITLAQGSERVWRCTNQDGTFPRAVHNFSSIPCFGSSFCSREARVHLLLSVYCTRSEGPGYDCYRPLANSNWKRARAAPPPSAAFSTRQASRLPSIHIHNE